MQLRQENALEPECLLLDITGLAAIFGGETALCELATRTLIRQGWLVRRDAQLDWLSAQAPVDDERRPQWATMREAR